MPIGPELDVTISGVRTIQRRLLRVSQRAVDGREAFRAIAGIFRRAVTLQFRTEGSYGGERWQDLQPSTLEQKQREDLDERILRATGALYDSLTDEGDTHHIQHITKKEMRWGSDLPYGIYHQKGAPRGHLPERPIIRLRESDKRAVQRSLFGTR
jgi:phage gpG-like protein